MNINSLSAKQLRRAAEIKEQIERLQNELNRLLGGQPAPTPAGKRNVSASARAKMSKAQKARWAKVRAAAKK